MNQTTTLNVWKGTNRVSLLWEELAAACVSPDPVPGEWIPPGAEGKPAPSISFVPAAEREAALPLETAGIFLPDLLPGRWDPGREATLLERVKLASMQWIRHALEVFSAPPEPEPMETQDRDDDQELPPVPQEEPDEGPVPAFTSLANTTAYGIMVRVSSEPEPQPASVIDTRRMAYGLKIPARPLHKRPVYQRVYFCLRQVVSRPGSRPSPR